MPQKSTPKANGLEYLFAALTASAAVLMAGSYILDEMQSPEEKHAAAVAKSKAEAAADAETRRERFGATVTSNVKSLMRDPDSFVLEKASVSENADLGCVSFRARNGFGGMNKGFAVGTDGRIYVNNVGQWNKHCTKGALYNVTDDAKWYMDYYAKRGLVLD